MKVNKYPKVIDPKTRKWQRYYRKGKCAICFKSKVEVSKNYSTAWSCADCQNEIYAKSVAPSAIRFF